MSARDWIATYHVGANEPNAPVRRFDGDKRITKTLIEWCRDEADEFLAALDAAGLAVVPKEPTVEMLTAGTEEWLTVRAMEDRAAVIWRAMLAAAKEGKR
jgi:hypothetical protein